MVVSLELFKNCIAAVEAQLKRDDILTDLLVGDECSGWVSTAPLLLDCMVKLLEDCVGDEDAWISWWLWEKEESKTDHIWADFKGEKYRFEIKDTEDLYYLILDDLEKIKNKYPDEPTEDDIMLSKNFGKFNEDSYRAFMEAIFGTGYTETDN